TRAHRRRFRAVRPGKAPGPSNGETGPGPCPYFYGNVKSKPECRTISSRAVPPGRPVKPSPYSLRSSAMLTTCLPITLVISAAPETAGGPPPQVGKAVVNFKLHDFRGAAPALDDYAQSRLIVVAFLGTACPLTNRYAARLTEFARDYGPR